MVADAAGSVPRWFPDDDSPTRLLLVRHGTTVHSHQRRFSGVNSLPLDDHGRAQADGIARHIARGAAVDVVCSSPLRRAQETATAIAAQFGIGVETVDELVEMEFGDWEGLTLAEAHAKWPDAITDWLAGQDIAPPGGESFGAVEQRVLPAVEKIVERHRGKRIAVVSHITPIKTVLRTCLAAPKQTMFKFHLDTASLSIVDYYADGTTSVRLINNCEHP